MCKCQNGGTCTDSGASECRCEENFVGQWCDVRRDAALARSSSSAAVIVPIFLIILVILSAVALYVYYQRKRAE